MKKTTQNKSTDKTQENIRNLVIARVKATPRNVRISIGAANYSQEELIENIQNNTDLGNEVMEMQMEYLRDLVSGEIYGDE